MDKLEVLGRGDPVGTKMVIQAVLARRGEVTPGNAAAKVGGSMNFGFMTSEVGAARKTLTTHVADIACDTGSRLIGRHYLESREVVCGRIRDFRRQRMLGWNEESSS